MQRRRTGRAIIAIVAVSLLAMMAAAVPASAIKKKVDVTLTALNGCTYHIDGTTSWSLATGWTFAGTVTVSGGPQCGGIIQFDPNSQRLQASLDTAEDRSVSRVSWQGSERAVAAVLNADEANAVISGAVTKALGGA